MSIQLWNKGMESTSQLEVKVKATALAVAVFGEGVLMTSTCYVIGTLAGVYSHAIMFKDDKMGKLQATRNWLDLRSSLEKGDERCKLAALAPVQKLIPIYSRKESVIPFGHDRVSE
jgi:hypothetical protein